jgi:aminoglycoside 3-N-acetyltransferase
LTTRDAPPACADQRRQGRPAAGANNNAMAREASSVPTSVTRADIAADLTDLGLGRGDVVFFHSSLKSLGWVEGGAEAVIEAFLDTIGPDGLVIVPTLTATFAPGCIYPDLVVHAFDPKETPSRVGAITDALWRRPEAFRSAHPTHSVAAIGRRAEELVQGHEHTSTFGQKSPYGRYVNWGAKILFLGVNLRCNTTLHAVEDWLDLPYMQPGKAMVKGCDGRPRAVTVTKSPMGDRDFYRRDSKVARLLEGAGLIRRGKVAAAETVWLPAREMVQTVAAAIHQRPDLLLCDSPDCEFCSAWRRPTIEHVRRKQPTI